MPSRKPKPSRRKKSKSGTRWSLYPELHADVSLLLKDAFLDFSFHEEDDEIGCSKEYDTNIMGRFTCNNSSCGSRGWSSMMIAITIRMYPGEQYNARPEQADS
ncbi:hypothetical protein TOPH_04601 [Tolypocladium ophioglossoides CBS 100239]|uniref:3CxxC-type domain-containing protein n=1 Tax=Tolypocladium ophioglossoides (strain CBS 100239) TaxID=1163406 RepID=A0A0L0N9L9_TOLOC|nr:hypothetical protein TOPH_04601 [Tolypocladium ophioglossoides CBS 100239]